VRSPGGESGETEQVLVRVVVQLQSVGDRGQDLGGGVPFASLLEPDVVVHAEPGQGGDLLATQPGDASSGRRRQADLLRRHLTAACTEEVPDRQTSGTG